jgi:hypothetical protein
MIFWTTVLLLGGLLGAAFFVLWLTDMFAWSGD